MFLESQLTAYRIPVEVLYYLYYNYRFKLGCFKHFDTQVMAWTEKTSQFCTKIVRFLEKAVKIDRKISIGISVH